LKCLKEKTGWNKKILLDICVMMCYKTYQIIYGAILL